MLNQNWPPEFSLEQEKILSLLTGDRFYSNPSAALREAILNAIDAVHRRRREIVNLIPKIKVTFDREKSTLKVADNGVGMNKDEVKALFVKVGASAATEEANKESVGEFGIGVISYFMAGEKFTLQTNDGKSEPIGLSFSRSMLSGGVATELPPKQSCQGTTIEIQISDANTFDLLLENFPHWCRDVEGLSAWILPKGQELSQKGPSNSTTQSSVQLPEWVESAHIHPVSDPIGWDAMTGNSTVAVLYRGVFVQEFEVKGLWGIEGTIDVDPKYFKPRLNREGFVEGQFQSEVTKFLQLCHPVILEALVKQLKVALAKGALNMWTVKRWANLWLSLPRDEGYSNATILWDSVFRTIPAFELAVGNKWRPISFDEIKEFQKEIFVAPLLDEKPSEVTLAALRLLRNTDNLVIRGIRHDRSWMRYANRSFGTTAELITTVFVAELPPLVFIVKEAMQILSEISVVACLFTGPPTVDLVRIGPDSQPALRLKKRLIINLDHEAGRKLVEDALRENNGPISLVASAARHTYEQLTQVAAVVASISAQPEILGPIRRQFIKGLLY